MTGRATSNRAQTWPCPYCDGKGCEECDDTGKRWRLFDGDFTASGTGEAPTQETVSALRALRAAAVDYMGKNDG